MAFTEQDVLSEVDAIMQTPDWQKPEKRGEFVRDVAVKTRGSIEPDFHSAVIGKLWEQVDDRGWARKTADFVGTAVGEVVKSMPAMGGAAVFAASDAVGATDTGSGTRLEQGAKTLIDATGQRLKQAMPGVSEQGKRDDILEALRGDLEVGALPPEFDNWLAGEYDNTDIPEGVKPIVDGLVSGFARQAVKADHGQVTPEKLRAWQETDRNPGRSGGDIPGQPGPRELLADFAATKDPASWAAFKSLVTETDAQHQARLRTYASTRESAATLQRMPKGIGKEMASRSMDMQSSPIDLVSSLLPALRGAKALSAAKKGGMAAALGNIAGGATKEGLQEGATEMLSDPRATTAQIAEAAGMGAVGSGVLEGGMAGVGASLRRISPTLQTPAASQSAPVIPPSGQAITPLGDIAAGTFQANPQPGQTEPVRRAPILGSVPEGGRRMGAFRDNPLAAPEPAAGGNVLRDFGIAKSPNAQAIADAAEMERQKQIASMQVRDGRVRKPVIPDSPLGGRDVLDFLNDQPLRIPRKGSQEAGQADNDWRETYDIPLYYRKFIARTDGGYEPNTLAQQAYEEGLINEPSVDALMAEVQSSIGARTQYKVEFRKRDQALKQEAQQVTSFEKDQSKAAQRDKTLVALDDVAPGDEMTINGEKAVVRKIDYDEDGYLTNVVIEDGKRYGVMSLDPTTRAGVFVDEYQPQAREQAAPDFEDPFSMQSVTEEELTAEKERAKQRATIAARQSAALTGDAGEYGTPDLLDTTAGDMALFNQPPTRKDSLPVQTPASVTPGPERAAADKTGTQAIGAGSSPAAGAPSPNVQTSRASVSPTTRLAADAAGGVAVPTQGQTARPALDSAYVASIEPIIRQMLKSSDASAIITEAAGRKLSEDDQIQVVVEWVKQMREEGSLALPSDFSRIEIEQAYLLEPVIKALKLQNTGFQNTKLKQDLQAGFLTDAGVDALFDLANAALKSGKTFVQWSTDMLRQFGEQVREFLAHVWAVAKDTLPTTAAQNIRLGGSAKAGSVTLNPSGAIINLLPALKGGTKVFHAQGEPFRVNYLGARELLTGSPLPAELVPVLTRTNQEKKALEQRAAQLGRDLQSAIDAHVDKSGLAADVVNAQVAVMMAGDAQTSALLSVTAPVLHERTLAVRKLLDNLSAAVAQTLPTGDLKQTIMGNLGAWLRRSYAAFDPASGWNYDALLRAAASGTQVNGKDAKKILDDARTYLRTQNPKATTEQIEADLRDLMDRNVWERELTGSGAKKSTSSLMRRKEIAPEIRAVMGEEQNPVKLLTSSSGFQAQFIARHHGQEAMRNAGLATALFATERGGVYTEQIPVNDRAWSGFAGVWTTPQMLKALENSSGVIKEGSDLGGLIVSTLKTLGNKAKLNRVALNPDSWMVNMLGNLTSLIQNGDVFAWKIIRRVQKAREITGAGDAKTGAVVNAAAEALQDASRDMQARLTEAGVLGSSLTLADIEASLPRHLLQWLALDQKADKLAGALEGAIVGQAMGRGLGATGRVIGGAIGGVAGAVAGGTKIQAWQQKVADFLMTKPDALARVTGWMTNYETALASGMAPDVAATWANERTLNTFPNYAALPGLVREASKLGLVGSFIAFQHEVYRNFGWNVRYATEELRSGNPALMARGLQRVAGIGSIAAMAGGGLAALLAATGVAGSDDERNKLYRKWFGAPWEKDAVLAFRDFDAEKVSYFNTSYLLPQTTIAELLQAVSEGETPEAAAGRVVDRLYEQFVGSSVHLGPLLGAAMNQKRTGAPITYRQGIAGAAERADEPLKTILEPGFAEKIERLTYAVRQAERNGTLYSIDQEFRRLIGLREQTKTWPRLVEGVYRELAKENSNIRSQANKELSLNRPGASQRAIDEANAQLDALRQKVADFERDTLKLGVPDYVIGKAKREASVGKIPRVVIGPDKRVMSLGQ